MLENVFDLQIFFSRINVLNCEDKKYFFGMLFLFCPEVNHFGWLGFLPWNLSLNSRTYRMSEAHDK